MSNENEWSDDNEDSDIPEQPDRGFPMSDEESESEDEEYRQLIFKKSIEANLPNYNNYTHEHKPVQRKRKEKIQNKKTYLNTTIESEVEKKTTWTSKRMETKKIQDGKVQLVKRKFTPRLPPPKNQFKNKNIKKNISNPYCISEQDFPDLS